MFYLNLYMYVRMFFCLRDLNIFCKNLNFVAVKAPSLFKLRLFSICISSTKILINKIAKI